ncbi:hypothetical protein Gxy13693_022_057 [Komagataeibacter xylinus NBRC 13693]|uniref:Uncharacterized protein n=1 Tax=Komagataeibacter xylinus NBRC 13693 TaxID=1234668 RepID=A0A0D6Q7N4_KOMXY|nr:hypothetical protein Gxy13693_022_057 [Komagataeibacter xylinus NBRC 13693]
MVINGPTFMDDGKQNLVSGTPAYNCYDGGGQERKAIVRPKMGLDLLSVHGIYRARNVGL